MVQNYIVNLFDYDDSIDQVILVTKQSLLSSEMIEITYNKFLKQQKQISFERSTTEDIQSSFSHLKSLSMQVLD